MWQIGKIGEDHDGEGPALEFLYPTYPSLTWRPVLDTALLTPARAIKEHNLLQRSGTGRQGSHSNRILVLPSSSVEPKISNLWLELSCTVCPWQDMGQRLRLRGAGNDQLEQLAGRIFTSRAIHAANIVVHTYAKHLTSSTGSAPEQCGVA